MSAQLDRFARGLTAFVENPYTNLTKGLCLLGIGVSDAWHTLFEDIAHQRLRAGHGMVVIGLFSVLGALPEIIEGLEAGVRYHKLRGRKRGESGD